MDMALMWFLRFTMSTQFPGKAHRWDVDASQCCHDNDRWNQTRSHECICVHACSTVGACLSCVYRFYIVLAVCLFWELSKE